MLQQQQGLAPITAVISTRNRGSEGARTVETILENDHPCFAVVLVDQSDDDRTEQAARRFAERPEFAYVRSRTRGLSAGRNEGIARSRSEFIAMTDDDCEVPRDWLRKMADAFETYERIGVVFGNVLAAKHDRSEGFIPAYERSEPYLARTIREKHEVEGIGACMGVRRSVWEAVSGFDVSLGPGARFGASDDFDFAIRALLAGYSVYAAPEAKVVHHGFRTWSTRNALISTYLYGIGAMYAKLFRAHQWASIILMWHLVWRWALAGPVVDFGRKPPRLLRLKAFLKGFLTGMSSAVDRRTGHYGHVQPLPLPEAVRKSRVGE